MKARYHVQRKEGHWKGPWDQYNYRIVMDRLSGAVLGYVLYDTTVATVYDRSGRFVETIPHGHMEELGSGGLLDPIDFAAFGLVGIGKKLIGQAVRTTPAIVESKVAREAVEGVASGTPRKLPPYQFGQIPPQAKGLTTWWGDIDINPAYLPVSRTTLLHESVHRFLSPRLTSVLGYRRGLMKKWFYEKSHLLKYAEEALAESYATLSLRKGLAFPFTHGYGIKTSCLVLEGGVGGIAYSALLYGGYKGGELGGQWLDKP